jgi:ribosomal protein L32
MLPTRTPTAPCTIGAGSRTRSKRAHFAQVTDPSARYDPHLQEKQRQHTLERRNQEPSTAGTLRFPQSIPMINAPTRSTTLHNGIIAPKTMAASAGSHTTPIPASEIARHP